jgi:formylglycine-generating enzyme required for sulfatase activity
MERLGVETAYGLLTASAFLPLLEACGQNPGDAVTTLVNVVSGVGSNLVSNLVQHSYDEATAPQRAEREIAERPELRREYQRVLGALDALGAAQAALGERWAGFEEKLAQELKRMGGELHVETDGGAVLFGDVEVRYGDFVARDKVEIYINEEAPPTDLVRAYYRSLANECRHLPLGVVDPKFTQPASEGEVALHQVYVNLDVVAPVRAEDEDMRAFGLRLSRGEGKGRTPLLEAVAQDEAARVVLLGDPGSGKTTFVNHLTYRLAEAAADEAASDLPTPLQGVWPVRLILREVATCLPAEEQGSAAMLWDAVHADVLQRLGETAAERLMPYLQERLLREGGLFLLDGLDEVPEAGRRRRCLLEAVQALIECLPSEGKVLLTARPYAYADPEWQLAGLPILALAPFDQEQVAHFVDRWYRAVRPAMGWSPQEAEARGQGLSDALQERPRLGDLASRPLLLTLMATLHTSWGQLPEDRADLYEESVKLLLARWQRAREMRTIEGERERQPGLTAALGVSEATVRTALERLAFEAHRRQGKAARRDEAPADVPAGEVLAVFSPLLPDDVNPRRVLTYLETRAGLLLGRRERVYAFLHRSFQEYLAACHLANTERDFGARLWELVWEDLDWWREVFLSGVGKKRQGGLGDAVNVVNALVPEGSGQVADVIETHWRAAALAGEALLDLNLLGQTAGRPHYQALLRRVRRWLVALLATPDVLAPRERAEAGDVLGRLGDQRPGVGTIVVESAGEATRLPDILWVEVPAGPFLMGSPEDDEMAYDDEHPQHELSLPMFYVARYPITNAQYRPFVERDGYDDPGYWTAEGWAWRTGEREPDLSVIDDEEWRERYTDWLAQRPVERRGEPFWWNHPRWGLANRPVVGITWYEALAYCAWLTEALQVVGYTFQVWRDGRLETPSYEPETFNVQLPSEAEWEKAARGIDGRRWPWGDEWTEGRANTEEANVEETSVVGAFPRGASPWGAMDMAGNVWEWTRSRWGRTSMDRPDYGYPYNDPDRREDLDGPDLRVLRGGSWYYRHHLARCTHRLRRIPVDFFSHHGFRMVVSMANAQS